jgi:phosphoenolpyruvate---glycerone phosphotransferase subunit DhaL
MRLLEGLGFMVTTPGFTTATLTDALRRIATRMELSADDLNALDGKLGDGDLGVTMSRGTAHVLKLCPHFPKTLVKL